MENTCMHEIIDKKFYLGPKFGILINKKWITISELLHFQLFSFDGLRSPHLTFEESLAHFGPRLDHQLDLDHH
jgi:hypothetical protein